MEEQDRIPVEETVTCSSASGPLESANKVNMSASRVRLAVAAVEAAEGRRAAAAAAVGACVADAAAR